MTFLPSHCSEPEKRFPTEVSGKRNVPLEVLATDTPPGCVRQLGYLREGSRKVKLITVRSLQDDLFLPPSQHMPPQPRISLYLGCIWVNLLNLTVWLMCAVCCALQMASQTRRQSNHVVVIPSCVFNHVVVIPSCVFKPGA